MAQYYTDRSRAETYQECPRLRYLSYEYRGRGVVPETLSLALTIGSSIHRGIADLLLGKDIEGVVGEVLEDFVGLVRQRALDLGTDEDQFDAAKEQAALLEALLRGWAECRLPRLLTEYQVIDVEGEEECSLGGKDKSLIWMSRPDAVLRHRGTQELTIYSIKTCAQWDQRAADQHELDMQGMSETYAVEQRLGEPVTSVQMDFLVKGRRDEFPRGSGRRRQASPLIRGWRQSFGAPMSDRYAWSYSWTSDDGTRHRLARNGGGAWQPYSPWHEGEMGLQAWFDLLRAGNVTPSTGENILESQFVTPPPHYRIQEDIDEWLVSTQTQEARVKIGAAVVENARKKGPKAFRLALAEHFPKNARACNFHYGGRCPFHKASHDVCWTGLNIHEQDPVESGNFLWRVPHHTPELAQQNQAEPEPVTPPTEE